MDKNREQQILQQLEEAKQTIYQLKENKDRLSSMLKSIDVPQLQGMKNAMGMIKDGDMESLRDASKQFTVELNKIIREAKK